MGDGPRPLGWDEMTTFTCRTLGGFDPDVHHRTNDAAITLALVARGLAVAMLPELPLIGHPSGVVARPIAERQVRRSIFAATRASDAARPSTRALLDGVRAAAAAIPRM